MITDAQIVAAIEAAGFDLAFRNFEDDVRLARAVLALAPGLSGWQEIETAPNGRKLIVGYPNQLGKWRTVIARYYLPGTLPLHDDHDWEADSDGYADEGWYEETETHEVIMPLECEPTHWMPLPAAPGLAPHQPQPEGDYQRGWKDGNDTANKVHAALAQPQPESQEAAERLEEFKHWLNKYRALDVSFVFHEIVDRYEAALSAPQEAADWTMNDLQHAYRKGWERAAEWAKRDDLWSDVGSPAYLKDMAEDLFHFSAPQEASKPEGERNAD